MDKEVIQKARRVNLAEYLMYRGEELKKDGRRYRHKRHDSLIFTDNAFYWNSRSEKGNSIDFLMLFYGMHFNEAVRELLEYADTVGTSKTKPHIPKDFQLSALRLDISTARAEKYLSDVRKISRGLVKCCISSLYIFQEYGTRNILFAMYDENRKTVGAEIHGSTKDGRFKGIAENSKYGYGFNIVYGKPKQIYFFESAIDLLSFLEIHIGKDMFIYNKAFVSMGGLKENIVKHMSALYTHNIILCVDNDEAGHKFVRNVQETFPMVEVMYPNEGKDWNEYLIKIKTPQ